MAASNFSCSGTVVSIGVHSTDKIVVRLSNMANKVYACNLTQTIGVDFPVAPSQCKVAYATLLLAYVNKKAVTIYFDNVESGKQYSTGECSQIKPWELATIRYVSLED